MSSASSGRLLELARAAGCTVEASCGGRGVCGTCTVFLEQGTFRIFGERVTLVSGERREVLACETEWLGGEAEVMVPRRAAVVDEGARIEMDIALPPHQSRPAAWRTPGGAVAAAFAGTPRTWTGVAGPLFGAAIDIGTSTVAIALVDLETGRVVDRAARFNQQILRGDDVAARIAECSRPDGLSALRDLVAAHTINPMVDELCERQGVEARSVCALAVGANTVMCHLLLGLSPLGIGTYPFTPVCREYPVRPAGEVGLRAHPEAPVFVAPSVAGYVGGDIVADVMASGFGAGPGLELLVDIGTNGEMVLSDGGRLSACATAAGPAFEGAGLMHGCRAVRGAIERIDIEQDVLTATTIGGAAPLGLCGSAVIDFLAEARRAGWLGPWGRFEVEALRRVGRLRTIRQRGHEVRACLLVEAADSGTGQPLLVTEADVAQVLKAKGAIYAGLKALVQRVGRHPRQLDRLWLAGGFARHLRLDRAMAIGLLPALPRDRVQVIGNGSLAGALLALLDVGRVPDFRGWIDRPEVVELNLQPGFADLFADAMALPHGDPDEFAPAGES